MPDSKSAENRILIVDDSVENRMLLSHLLVKNGYSVDECEDGEQCLEYCTLDKSPSIILLDVVMPKMDGIAVCEQLRTQFSKEQLPIILCTGKVESNDIVSGLKAGANDYVPKPFDRSVLLARIENQLALSRANRALEVEKERLRETLLIQKTLGDSLPEGIAVSNSDGTIVYYNEFLRAACGGNVPLDIVDLLNTIFGGCMSIIHGGIRINLKHQPHLDLNEEFELEDSNGLVIQLISSPIKQSGSHDMRYWIWRNRTEIRALERRIAQEFKLESVGLFATGVAHNFNNIMGAVRGACELLKKLLIGNSKGTRYIELIERALAQGQNLSTKMLVLSTRNRGNPDVCAEDPVRVLRSLIEVQQELVGDRISFALEVKQKIPLLRVSTNNLVDIFSNLVSNSIDAITSVGEIGISISYDKLRDSVNIQITDNGTGIEPEALARVYEPFFSTKNLDDRNGVSTLGNGLGLWNVYNLIKMLGAQIDIKSRVGVGTNVILTFPLSIGMLE